jgi:hypothetical protein
MTFAALLKFAPWIGGAIAALALFGLVVDRNHLAKLNTAHQACLASAQAKPGSKPIDQACEKIVADAVRGAAAAKACDAALTGADAFGVESACSTPVKTLQAQHDADAASIANLTTQLDVSDADRNAAVSRAESRAHASAQGLAHAQTVLSAAPRGADGLSRCDADCLRGLTAPADGGVHPSP